MPPTMQRVAFIPALPCRHEPNFSYVDERYPMGSRPVADVRVYDRSDGSAVLVASQREDNPGASVTNTIERLVDAAISRFRLDPSRLTVIEHYPAAGPRNDRRPATWDSVSLVIWNGRARSPAWKRSSAIDVYMLTGDSGFTGVTVSVVG